MLFSVRSWRLICWRHYRSSGTSSSSWVDWFLAAAVGWVPHLLRATIEGHNFFPSWQELRDPSRWLRDGVRFAGLLVLAALPFLLLLLTRSWHVGLGASSGFFGWWMAAVFGWLAVAFVVSAGGASEAFGTRQIPRLSRHARGLMVGGAEALLAADGIFVLIALMIVLGVTLVPSWPWLGLPLVRAAQVYGLMVAPHLIGVVVRRHRLELRKIYSG